MGKYVYYARKIKIQRCFSMKIKEWRCVMIVLSTIKPAIAAKLISQKINYIKI